MGADYTLHVFEEKDLDIIKRFKSNALGSAFFGASSYEEHSKHFDADYNYISSLPDYFIGGVSWLKAALFNDDKYIPDFVGEISEVIDTNLGYRIIDDKLIAEISKALSTCEPTHPIYNINLSKNLLGFLEKHKGKLITSVSW